MRRNVTTKTDFGFQEVNIEEKEFMVKDVFSKVAQKYDIMNDLMSFGIHRLWKDEFVDMMGFKNLKISNISEIPRHLDVAGGTGDIAIRSANQIWTAIRHLPEKESILTDLTGNEKTVVVCDINPDMLAVGKDRASKVMEYNKSKMVIYYVLISLITVNRLYLIHFYFFRWVL
jgi:2-methoxy-6-polyprenyl-1,4-benzoquinol methylase